jgi:integrase
MTVLNNFRIFCLGQGLADHLKIDVCVGVEYLTTLFESGKSYSNINLARSALSRFVQITDESNTDFGKHPLVTNFMKGVFRKRPNLPRYNSTWDVSPVLTKLTEIPNESTTKKLISMKCATLLALVSGQRVQTLAAINIKNIQKLDDKVVISFDKVLKTSRPGHHTTVEICSYNDNPNLCPVKCLEAYLNYTSSHRQHDSLFLGLCKPYKPVSTQTISRWICLLLHSAGVSTKFGAHSTRSASTSKAASRTDINCVLKAAGWSSRRTFDVFYNKPKETTSFTHAVLGDN